LNRAAAEARGRKAERRAAWWLRLHGWRIVGERLRVPVGEVDLVAAARSPLSRSNGATAPPTLTLPSIIIACAVSLRPPKC
jgi:hypothetical protein